MKAKVKYLSIGIVYVAIPSDYSNMLISIVVSHSYTVSDYMTIFVFHTDIVMMMVVISFYYS